MELAPGATLLSGGDTVVDVEVVVIPAGSDPEDVSIVSAVDVGGGD